MTFWISGHSCYSPALFHPSSLYHACRARNSTPNSSAPSWRAAPITTAPAPEDLDALFAKERVTAYIGFDCTAKSMHIGNLVQLMTLRRLQQAGHRPILLMGGGTTKAGDPSGKDETRHDPDRRSRSRRTSSSMLSGVQPSAEVRRRAVATPSWSTMPNGWTGWNTFRSCARSAGTSRSTAC